MGGGYGGGMGMGMGMGGMGQMGPLGMFCSSACSYQLQLCKETAISLHKDMSAVHCLSVWLQRVLESPTPCQE